MSTVPAWSEMSKPLHMVHEPVPADAPTILQVITAEAERMVARDKRAAEWLHIKGDKFGRHPKKAPTGPLVRTEWEDVEIVVEEGAGAGAGAGAGGKKRGREEEEPPTPVYGRVTHVGKIVHYGTRGTVHKCPFKFTFRLGECDVSLVGAHCALMWPAACVRDCWSVSLFSSPTAHRPLASHTVASLAHPIPGPAVSLCSLAC
jgi:hypothetical protein